MNENLISETIKKWTPNLELYRCLSEQEFEFEDGLKHTKSFFVYDDDFPLEEKALYIYDDEKRLIKEEVLEFDNEGVESHYAYDYTYNQCDLVEEIISSSRDFITNEWQERGVRKYYYSQVTSIDEIEQSFVFLYPNPVSELLEIEIGGEVGIKKLEVCDMYGRKLMSQDVSSCRFIDVSFLENGNYVLVVNLGDRSYTKPFIKL